MNLRQSRTEVHDNMLKGIFIKKVLEQNARELDADIKNRIKSFNSSFWANRNFSIIDNTLIYSHPKQERFVDMKTRHTNAGIERKKHHPIHNKPIFAHLNNIIRELSFGFTESVKAELKQLDNTKI